MATKGLLVAALAAGLAATAPLSARAQDVSISATPKGTIGLGLVGAELGFVIPAAVGLDDTWAFIVFPVIGAGGGAAAGYFLLDDPDHAEAAIAALAVGVAAVIPVTVLTLDATAYDPDDEPTTDDGGDDAEASRASGRALRAGGGLLRRSESGWLLGVPAVDVGTLERATPLAPVDGIEASVSVVSGVF